MRFSLVPAVLGSLLMGSLSIGQAQHRIDTGDVLLEGVLAVADEHSRVVNVTVADSDKDTKPSLRGSDDKNIVISIGGPAYNPAPVYVPAPQAVAAPVGPGTAGGYRSAPVGGGPQCCTAGCRYSCEQGSCCTDQYNQLWCCI